MSLFDHIDFPGVVPRSFVGPLLLSSASLPVQSLFHISPIATLYLVRILLGTLTAISLLAIRNAIASRFSKSCASFFILITISQFHLMFYASRTLPNIFALVLTNIAISERIRANTKPRSHLQYIILSVACALFRSELCIYIFFALLFDLLYREIQLLKTCLYGILSAVVTATISIGIDSYFWQRLCYPELEVFYFNVIQNKSSAWGTEHPLWYFTNAIPRAIGGSYLLAMVSIVTQFKQIRNIILPALLFIIIYSVLPHKELRFIFYVLPAFNTAAALELDSIYREFRAGISSRFTKQKDDLPIQRMPILLPFLRVCLVLGILAVSCLQTTISVLASRENYPAGHAATKMFEMESAFYQANNLCDNEDTAKAYVHIDIDSAMNGISQFVQGGWSYKETCPKWTFSKREDWENIDWNSFTHLITDRYHIPGFERIHTQNIFDGIDYGKLQFITSERTFVQRRKDLV